MQVMKTNTVWMLQYPQFATNQIVSFEINRNSKMLSERFKGTFLRKETPDTNPHMQLSICAQL